MTKRKSEHTPGPWEYGVHRSDGKADGAFIWDRKYNSGIAKLWADPKEMEECRANAQIIAAAPDMLAALRAVRDRLTDPMECGAQMVLYSDSLHPDEDRGGEETILDYLNEVISNAKGE